MSTMEYYNTLDGRRPKADPLGGVKQMGRNMSNAAGKAWNVAKGVGKIGYDGLRVTPDALVAAYRAANTANQTYFGKYRPGYQWYNPLHQVEYLLNVPGNIRRATGDIWHNRKGIAAEGIRKLDNSRPAAQQYYGDIDRQHFYGYGKPVARAAMGVVGNLATVPLGGAKAIGWGNRALQTAFNNGNRLKNLAIGGLGIGSGTVLEDLGNGIGEGIFDYFADDPIGGYVPPGATPRHSGRMPDSPATIHPIGLLNGSNRPAPTPASARPHAHPLRLSWRSVSANGAQRTNNQTFDGLNVVRNGIRNVAQAARPYIEPAVNASPKVLPQFLAPIAVGGGGAALAYLGGRASQADFGKDRVRYMSSRDVDDWKAFGGNDNLHSNQRRMNEGLADMLNEKGIPTVVSSMAKDPEGDYASTWVPSKSLEHMQKGELANLARPKYVTSGDLAAHINLTGADPATALHEGMHVEEANRLQRLLRGPNGEIPSYRVARSRLGRYDSAEYNKKQMVADLVEKGKNPADYADVIANSDYTKRWELQPGASLGDRIRALGYSFENTPIGQGIMTAGRIQAGMHDALGIAPNSPLGVGLNLAAAEAPYLPKHIEEARATWKGLKNWNDPRIGGNRLTRGRRALSKLGLLGAGATYLVPTFANAALNQAISNYSAAYSDAINRDIVGRGMTEGGQYLRDWLNRE